jgi:hypothetical protein
MARQPSLKKLRAEYHAQVRAAHQALDRVLAPTQPPTTFSAQDLEDEITGEHPILQRPKPR